MKISKIEQVEGKHGFNNHLGLKALVAMEMSRTSDVDFLYESLVSALINTAYYHIPSKKLKSFQKPYWCDSLSDIHNFMKKMSHSMDQCGKSM